MVNVRKEAAQEGHLPVEIGLSPGPTKSVRLGAGYGTDTGPRATLRYRDVNMFDQGQEWHTEAKISPVFQGISSPLSLPFPTGLADLHGPFCRRPKGGLTDYVSKLYKVEMERVYGLSDSRVGSVFLQARGEESHAGEQVTNTFSSCRGSVFPPCTMMIRSVPARASSTR